MRKSREARRTTPRRAIAEAIERRLLMSTYTVNTLSDAITPITGQLTLRQAVADANANPGADSIAFDQTVFTPGSSQSIVLLNGPISFTDAAGATTVTGPGSTVLAVDGNRQSQVFQISTGVTVSISGLTVTNGAVNALAGVLVIGGGVQNAGVLTLTDVTVSNNTITASNTQLTGVSGGAAFGGGIYSTGTLSLMNSSVSGNSAFGGSSQYDSGGAAAGGGIYSTGLLTLTGSSIFGNNASGGDGGPVNSVGYAAGDARGGGIFSSGTLSVITSSVSGNSALGGGSEYTYSGNSSGGGIYSSGPLTISGSSILGNDAAGGGNYRNGDQGIAGDALGGGIFSSGQTVLNSSNVSSNVATGGTDELAGAGYGGGIYLAGGATLSGDTLNKNQAIGGYDPSAYGGISGSAWGGAVYSTAALSISSSTLTGNTATGGTGTFEDYGPAGNASGGAIAAQGSLTISSSTVSSNLAQGGPAGDGYNDPPYLGARASGGGIYAAQQLTVSNCTVLLNTAQGAGGGRVDTEGGGPGQGGGIATFGTGVISETEITGNVASGGVGTTGFGYNSLSGYPSGDGEGGGVFNGGVLAVVDSTVSGNQATGGVGAVPGSAYAENEYAGTGGDGFGAGIFSSSTLTVENSTITANAASGGHGGNNNGGGNGIDGGNGGNGEGGGIYCTPLLTLYDSTIVGNAATAGTGGTAYSWSSNSGINGTAGLSDGGGIYAGKNSVLDNSILSANNAASGADVYSSLSATSSYNLIGYGGGLTNSVNGNIVGIQNPDLTPPGNYGGPTQTMLPLAGSPVIDKGSNSLIPTGVTTDQRGYARIVGSSVDIGAVEYTAGVSGNVFNDVNGDAIRQTGEPGLAGVRVYADIIGSGVFQAGDPSTITDSLGNYVLNGLPAGMDIIRQVIPAGYRQTYPIVGAGEHVMVGAAAVAGANFADSTRLYVAGSVTLNGVAQSGVQVYADLNNDGKFESNENNKATASDGSFAFQSLGAGTYTFRIVPPAGEVQSSPAGNAGITVTLGSGGVQLGLTFGLSNLTPLTGKVIGTSGSYNNQGNTAAKAFDGNLNTFFDAPTPSGSWAGLDLGTAKIITQISYAPRRGWALRMVGGVFQASNSPTFAGGVVMLYTITATPATGVLTTVPISNNSAYRYVRYLGPTNSYCDIAEAQFFGTASTTPIKLTGIPIGTSGSYHNHGTTIANALDGNLATFFDGPDASGEWVGLDLGSAKVVTRVQYAPRAGWETRMVGGQIQASSFADFSSGVVALVTISATPTAGVLTTQLLSNTTPYRYYRYIGPANSYCDIAELAFLG